MEDIENEMITPAAEASPGFKEALQAVERQGAELKAKLRDVGASDTELLEQIINNLG